MAILVGLLLALAVSLFGTFSGLDRERSFYSVILVVVASYYGLFAVMGASDGALTLEFVVFVLFAAAACIGFKKDLRIVAAALAAHGLFDLVHSGIISNPGVPQWWPPFCASYDLAAGLYLALLLRKPVAKPPVRKMADNALASNIEAQLGAAALAASRGDLDTEFRFLERAHILSQASTRQHVRVHWLMLRWALRQRNCREAAGQILRIAGAAALTAIGWVPKGNSGGSNVSAFRALPIPDELAAQLAPTPTDVRAKTRLEPR
jgi:hypothetical protein